MDGTAYEEWLTQMASVDPTAIEDVTEGLVRVNRVPPLTDADHNLAARLSSILFRSISREGRTPSPSLVYAHWATSSFSTVPPSGTSFRASTFALAFALPSFPLIPNEILCALPSQSRKHAVVAREEGFTVSLGGSRCVSYLIISGSNSNSNLFC